MATLKPTSVPSKRLSETISGSAAAFKLNNILGWDGAALTSADFGSVAYAVFRNSAGTLMEIIEFDPSTIASASITILRRGLKFTGDLTTEVSGNKLTWVRGDTIVELGSHPPQLLNSYVDLYNEQTLTGLKSVPTPTAAAHIATKAYVDAAALGSATVDRVVVAGVAGETVAAGNLLYFDLTDNEWKKTDADTAATLDGVMLGIAQGAGTDGNAISGGVLLHGIDTNQSGMTQGDLMYASNTAGGISSSAGTTSKVIGIARTTTNLYFDPIFNNVLTATQAAAIPSAGEKLALAGSLGTPGTSNKYITQINVSDVGADQSQTTQNATVEVGEADATTKKNLIAQSFTAGYTKIRGVKLYKAANTGTFTGTVKVALQADTAGSPSGSDLASVTLTNAVYLALATGEFEAIFSTEYASLTVGSLYWIVVTCSTSDNSNHPNLGTNSAGGYGSGSVKFKNVTDGWTAIATIDLYFKTIIGSASQVVKTDSNGKIDNAFLYDKLVYMSPTEVSGGTSSGAEFTLFTARIPGGTLGTNRVIEFEFYLSTVSIQNTFSFDIFVKYGGTTIATLEVFPTNMSGWNGYVRGRILADGATNAQKNFTHLLAYASASDSELETDAAVGIGKAIEIDTGSSAVDSTQDQNLVISAQASGSHGSNALTAEWLIVKALG